MTYLVFADEQKKIEHRWDYHALIFISKQKAQTLYDYILELRTKYNFYGEIKFTGINKKGTGTTLDIISDLLRFIYTESTSKDEPSLFFSITGIDRYKIDYSFFGDDDKPSGKYANIYNRFFRSSLDGAISYFFNQRSCDEISHILHDSEGNLEHHGYFDWHVISKMSSKHDHIKFSSEKVTFINSDHKKEEKWHKCSHLIQVVDILIGAVTHCIHFENKKNKGKDKASEIILPLVNEILNPKPRFEEEHYTYRRYSISHFPKNKITDFDGTAYSGEFYRLKTLKLIEGLSPQKDLFDIFQ